jgi:hypothetical protein
MANRALTLVNDQKNRAGTPKASLLAVSAVIYTADAAIEGMFRTVKTLTL